MGPALALTSALLFGLSAPAAKLLLGVVDPWLLAGLLYLGSGAGLALYRLARWFRSHAMAEATISRHQLPWLAGAIVCGGVVGPALLMFGLTGGSATQTSLLLNLEGVFTALLAWFVFRENFDARIALGMATIAAGAVVLSWQPSGALTLDRSALLVAGACLAWAIDNNLTRMVSQGDPVQIAMVKGAVAGSVNLTLALGLGAAWPTTGIALSAAVVGLLGYGTSLALFVAALRLLGTARAGAYFSTAPFVGAIGAVVILAEPLTAQLLLAAGLMGIGVWLHLTERHEHEHAHAAIEHDHLHRHDVHHQHDHAAGTSVGEPHSHPHAHAALPHSHPHYPDLHHRHPH